MHKVYCFFMLNNGWDVQFLEPDLKTPLPRRLTFSTPEKVRELHKRFGMDRTLENGQILEYAINMGRGSIWLMLDDDQYRTLKSPHAQTSKAG